MVNKNRLTSAYGWLTLEIWLLIALGGGVRAMNAGLACPDWPLCFGDMIPDYHPQVYFEFVHRAMAGMVGIVSLVLAILVWRSREINRSLKWLAFGSLLLLAAQIVLGGLTVLWLLHDKVVVGHLMLAAGFLGLNLWMYLSLKLQSGDNKSQKLPGSSSHDQGENITVATITKGFAAATVVMLLVVIGQMTLGGLVASNYAALVCSEFPLCHGKFIPTLSGALGLHIMHRLGAYTTMLVVLLLGAWAWRARLDLSVRKNMMWMVTVVIWQMGVGIANVLFFTPPLITVIHLASGMALLGLAVKQLFLVRSQLGRTTTKITEKIEWAHLTPFRGPRNLVKGRPN